MLNSVGNCLQTALGCRLLVCIYLESVHCCWDMVVTAHTHALKKRQYCPRLFKTEHASATSVVISTDLSKASTQLQMFGFNKWHQKGTTFHDYQIPDSPGVYKIRMKEELAWQTIVVAFIFAALSKLATEDHQVTPCRARLNTFTTPMLIWPTYYR